MTLKTSFKSVIIVYEISDNISDKNFNTKNFQIRDNRKHKLPFKRQLYELPNGAYQPYFYKVIMDGKKRLPNAVLYGENIFVNYMVKDITEKWIVIRAIIPSE